MKRLTPPALQLLVLTLASPGDGAAQAEPTQPSAPVTAVWALEDAYWKYVKAGDVTSYRTLWDERFVGWPCVTAHPAGKDSIGNWVRRIRDEHIRLSSELKREAAADFGDLVVVYYSTPIIREYPDGHIEGRDTVWKFTHTWRLRNDTWQIVGGMCGLPMVGTF